jgi:hypothetical protein
MTQRGGKHGRLRSRKRLSINDLKFEIENLKSKIPYNPFAANHRSASSAAMQPLPAAVIA